MLIPSIILAVIVLSLYVLDVSRHPFQLKTMIIISIFGATAFMLSTIKFITMPQGGGVSLFSMLPILLVGLLFGRREGMTAGLLFGALSLLNNPYIVHPIQLVLDYLLCTMMLGTSGMFGTNTKWKVLLGSATAVFLSVMCNVLSGVVFFAEYAPAGMNVWWYSIIYNFSSAGVEGALCLVLLTMLPFRTVLRAAARY